MALTPMMKQYYDMKSQHEDSILFFRLGDFYEMFFEDAYKASRILGLTLTSRGKDENDNKIPMCGIPYHAANNYIPKLLAQNIKVAICEQTEDAGVSKGITKREVINVITPGTIIEDNLLNSKQNNFLLAVSMDTIRNSWGIAYCDISTGEFNITELHDQQLFMDEITKIDAKEILVPTTMDESLFREFYTSHYQAVSIKESKTMVQDFFNIHSLESIGLSDYQIVFPAINGIIKYLEHNKKLSSSLQKPKMYSPDLNMFINSVTMTNLEIVSPLNKQSKAGSLLWVLDRTKTAMGARLLRKWCIRPLYNIEDIQKRLDNVDYFYSHFDILKETETILDSVYDLERLKTKLVNNLVNPKDMVSIKHSLQLLPNLHNLLNGIPSEIIDLVIFPSDWLVHTQEIVESIENTINNDPPAMINSGGFIRPGFSSDLDKYRQDISDSKIWFINLEKKLKEETGIKSLKISYNRVFGYYIDVTSSNLHLVPETFIRKQTLANSERYYTEELKAKEDFVLHADEIIIKKEVEIFDNLVTNIQVYSDILSVIAEKLAILDCISSLARVAKENAYTKPIFNALGEIHLLDSRHPVVEQNQNNHQFIANDAELNNQEQFIILTGPNMAGKSTYMRQVALILLMSQIGSFVPAKKANLCLVDKLFARIGASDNLFEGKSTFMVEMLESANIIHNATDKSFIIMDEIGRGTSTFDGLSIAASIAKYIINRIGAKTLFATHYHEMTSLSERYPKMKNMSIAVLEEGGKIRFTYKVVPGKAEKSYGIHVGELAGLPTEVIDEANRFLDLLEEEQISLYKTSKSKSKQLSLF